MARPRDIAESRAERARWEAAGRPAPTPSGAPRRTGRREVKPAEVKPELAKTPTELEKGFALAQIRIGKMPEGSKVLSRNADGTPETYEYQGQTYYAPGSTMYKMGWRSQSDYVKGQRMSAYGGYGGELVPEGSVVVDVKRGDKVISVAVPPDKPVKHRQLAKYLSRGQYRIPVIAYDVTGKKHTRFITPEQSKELSRVKGKEQFNLMLKMGMLPPGSKFGREKEEGRGWTYIPAAQAEALDKLALYTDFKGNVAIDKYLRDHPGDVGTLYAAGFKGSEVEAAQDYNFRYFGTGVKYVPEQDFALERKVLT